MWLSDRRQVLLGALALGACGFEPVYGPGGAGASLQGRIHAKDPSDADDFRFLQRFEERLGRGGAEAPLLLQYTITTNQTGQGSTSAGRTVRMRLNGTARFSIRRAGSGEVAASGSVSSFTSYSNTGSTVATLAAEKDAHARLMVILADLLVDDLLLRDLMPNA